MTSKAVIRSAEDIDEKALSYAKIKALATGNPLIIKKTELDTEVSKLKLLKQSYMSQIYNLEDKIVKYYPIEIKRLQNKIINIENDITNIEYIGEYRGLKMFLSIDGFKKKFMLELQGNYTYRLELETDIYGNIKD